MNLDCLRRSWAAIAAAFFLWRRGCARAAAGVLVCALAFFVSAPSVWAKLQRMPDAQTQKYGTIRSKVETVLDGDTVILSGGERLRLRGIDAPEIRHGDTPGQYYGRESSKFLTSLVKGRDIFIRGEELTRDRYHRLVGIARLEDGRIVNLLMVEEGAAFVYPHPTDTDEEFAQKLLFAQTKAMNEGKGFWAKLLALPAQRFIGTRNSRRFHVFECANAKKIGKNRIIFSSLREAFAAGYAPARECTPWPTAGGK